MSDPGTHEGTASPFRGSRLRAGVREAFLEEDEGDGSSARTLQRPFGISRDAVRQQDSCPIVTCRPRLALEAGPGAQQHGGGGRRQGAATHRSCRSQGPRLAAQEAAPGTPGGHDSRASSVPGQARLLRAGPPGRVSQGALSFPLAMRGCPRLSGRWLAAPMPTFFNAPVSSPKNFTLQRGP